MSVFCMADKYFCDRKSFVWPDYYVLIKFFENKNHDVKVTIKFGAVFSYAGT